MKDYNKIVRRLKKRNIKFKEFDSLSDECPANIYIYSGGHVNLLGKNIIECKQNDTTYALIFRDMKLIYYLTLAVEKTITRPTVRHVWQSIKVKGLGLTKNLVIKVTTDKDMNIGFRSPSPGAIYSNLSFIELLDENRQQITPNTNNIFFVKAIDGIIEMFSGSLDGKLEFKILESWPE